MPKVDVTAEASKDDRFKLGQLVTCIIDPSYDNKKTNKGVKRRALKKEMKQDEIEEAQREKEEVERLKEEKENLSVASNKSTRSKKSRKLPLIKKKDTNKEELKTPQKKMKIENDYLAEIEKILDYSKKSKSPSDMDFSIQKPENKDIKVKSPTSVKKSKKLNRFKEYLEWYDSKSKLGKASVSSKAPSTVLSTPAKISLRISERMARAKKVR